jgi:hypothetical protein
MLEAGAGGMSARTTFDQASSWNVAAFAHHPANFQRPCQRVGIHTMRNAIQLTRLVEAVVE